MCVLLDYISRCSKHALEAAKTYIYFPKTVSSTFCMHVHTHLKQQRGIKCLVLGMLCGYCSGDVVGISVIVNMFRLQKTLYKIATDYKCASL